jgi:glycosyltransferase involved in cell wall biosynthesis
MKNLVIISQSQFGYHTDTYYYCKYLKEEYAITYLCWDHSLPKIEMDGVQVVYVNREGNALVRALRFLRKALKEIDSSSKPIVFIKYFKGVSLLLRLLRPKHYFVLDIRTGSVHHHPMVRRFEDARLKFETLFFKNVTIISESLAEKLCLTEKAHILPLGADVISDSVKSFDGLHLLYVGTLFNRNIDVTIRGFKQFYEEFKDKLSLSYTIIGSGPNNEEQILKEMVAQYGLSGIVTVTGEILHTQLKSWFDKANVGVSYVPMTDYYDCQPVTKTFEYLLSGIPVIATATSENKKVVDQSNGVLAGDTVEEFCCGLEKIYQARQQFDSTQIRNKALCYSWENIVRKNLHTYLSKVDET